MRANDGMVRAWLLYVLLPWTPLALGIAYLLEALKLDSPVLWLLVLGPPAFLAGVLWVMIVVVSGTK